MCRAEGGLCACCFKAKKKEGGGKEELIFLEPCVVEMYLEEKRGIFLLLGKGAG